MTLEQADLIITGLSTLNTSVHSAVDAMTGLAIALIFAVTWKG